MAAPVTLSLTQLSSGNPVYEKYYRQVDPANSGKVSASEAAAFLKKSGLTDLTLGKVWDVADSNEKGYLNKQEFFIALRLVACAQNGLDVSLSSLTLAVPPPKFHDTSSPLHFSGTLPRDIPWAVKVEEKAKFDVIFDSLNPVNGVLSGEKVKPVLINSKLPVDVLGRVWELSDIDRDGFLDRDEFAVAMHLVYRALEKEQVPLSLPYCLVPLSKRKKSTASPVPLLPSPPSAKELRQSVPPVATLPPVAAMPPKDLLVQWVVSPAEKVEYDKIFLTADKDMDGFVSGIEVRDIFINTGLPSSTLAHIWSLCDTQKCGKLSKERFALALYLINQKLKLGIEPPRVISPEMIPPTEKATAEKNTVSFSLMTDFSAIKELDFLNNEIADLQKEKSNVEQEIKEKEEAVRERASEVHDLQDEIEKETINLQKLQSQRQEVQDVLCGLDEKKAVLEEQLSDVRQKCTGESQLILSLNAEITSQDSKISQYTEELLRAREELILMKQETTELEDRLQKGRAQLDALQQSLHDSKQELSLVEMKLLEIKESESEVSRRLSWRMHHHPNVMVNGTADRNSLSNSDGDSTNLSENVENEFPVDSMHVNFEDTVKRESPDGSQKNVVTDSTEPVNEENLYTSFTVQEEFLEKKPQEPSQPVTDANLVFFQSDPFTGNDPFKDDPFEKVDPFGGDPFKGTDPFAVAASTEDDDDFFKQSSTDPFALSSTDPFGAVVSSGDVNSVDTMKSNDPFAPGGTVVAAATDTAADPFASFFGNEPFGSDFADFSSLAKPSSADLFSATLTNSMDNAFSSKNVFEEDPQKNEDVPPALPPKTGTLTRPPPPPPVPH
ncbi:epidermal growth factor receptor substrate 15 isoform X2 [Protopterus annectens]|uniref:epidermal growth factor receptor substrate 15 isoform X2 n=1 Tax=Protopterus annectens TaxID=7888 RepID=UPI001CFBC60E|nr:epidermal growth factor receptor substrate 15 isoform X2 [Protopterus annectens]